MSDLNDEAIDLAVSTYLDQALLNQKRKAFDPPPDDWDRETCSNCGDDLPEFRIERELHRCIACQTRKEVLNKQRA